MTVLVIAEHDQVGLTPASLSTLRAASELGTDVQVLLLAPEQGPFAKQAAALEGVSKVIVMTAPVFAHALAGPIAEAVLSIASNYQYVLTPATTQGKNFLPRVAATLGVGQLSDVIAIDSPDTFVRPIYAGNALATVQSSDAIKVLSIRATAFAPQQAGGEIAPIEAMAFEPSARCSEFVSAELTEGTRPELTSADVVVSGGRGLQNKENFVLIENLADALGAAVGASRAAVDAGFVPNDYQVGQTGKVVAPGLYVAVGISGAIQHLAGMKDSKVIVAINKDEDAPIFQVADFGLVGDLFELVPQLTEALT